MTYYSTYSFDTLMLMQRVSQLAMIKFRLTAVARPDMAAWKLVYVGLVTIIRKVDTAVTVMKNKTYGIIS
jgi:hypothetical protein